MEPKLVLDLLQSASSTFHAVAWMQERLKEEGFTELKETEPFVLTKGGKYFLTRNGTSVIAFVVPTSKELGYRIAASHNDSPTFFLKPNPVLEGPNGVRLNVEPYGGMIYYTWLDRPLGIAGQVMLRDKQGKVYRALFDSKKPVAVIPSIAIHQNREVNRGYAFDPASDLIPLWLDAPEGHDFRAYLAKELNTEDEVLSFDLSLYVFESPALLGEGKYLLSSRLDDLASAGASLGAFLETSKGEIGHMPVFVSFDNEEVGSLTAQGAQSDFLRMTLDRIADALGYSAQEKGIALANTVLLSVDNAHANHPNKPGLADATTKVTLNGGIVLKYNVEQHYTTSGVSSAYVKDLCFKLGEPVQEFNNRSDLRSGGTLGNLSNGQVSVTSADIGIAQLAMHSSVELLGYEDVKRMMDLLLAHYRN